MFSMTPSNLILLGICSFTIGIILFIWSIRHGRLVSSLIWLAVISLSAAIVFAGLFSKTFIKFNEESLVAKIRCAVSKDREYDFNLEYTPVVKGKIQPAAIFPMKGKEWMISGDIIKWKPILNLLGIHTYYRITRLSGRYPSGENHIALSETAYSLKDETLMSNVLRKTLRVIPVVDATYGTAVYTMCEFDKTFGIYVGRSGFIIRFEK
jgi:hypothetical protein